jgi:hypothetical protein
MKIKDILANYGHLFKEGMPGTTEEDETTADTPVEGEPPTMPPAPVPQQDVTQPAEPAQAPDPNAGEVVRPLMAAGEYAMIEKIAKAATTDIGEEKKAKIREIMSKMKSEEINPDNARDEALKPIMDIIDGLPSDPLARAADKDAFPPENMS